MFVLYFFYIQSFLQGILKIKGIVQFAPHMPQKINLTAIKGNWALVSVFDIDRTPKTGYVRWRSPNGVKYYFPAMK